MPKQIGFSAILLALALALVPLQSRAATGNFMSSCELEIFAAGQKLGVQPAITAPGTDGPNTANAFERRFENGQPEILSAAELKAPSVPPPPAKIANEVRALLTRALVAARRGDDFVCELRVEDALRVGGVPSVP